MNRWTPINEKAKGAATQSRRLCTSHQRAILVVRLISGEHAFEWRIAWRWRCQRTMMICWWIAIKNRMGGESDQRSTWSPTTNQVDAQNRQQLAKIRKNTLLCFWFHLVVSLQMFVLFEVKMSWWGQIPCCSAQHAEVTFRNANPFQTDSSSLVSLTRPRRSTGPYLGIAVWGFFRQDHRHLAHKPTNWKGHVICRVCGVARLFFNFPTPQAALARTRGSRSRTRLTATTPISVVMATTEATATTTATAGWESGKEITTGRPRDGGV